MIKIILQLFLLIFLINTAFVSCEDINMDVYAVEKNESCYTFFSVIFEDKGCEYECFEQISNFLVIQGNTTI